MICTTTSRIPHSGPTLLTCVLEYAFCSQNNVPVQLTTIPNVLQSKFCLIEETSTCMLYYKRLNYRSTHTPFKTNTYHGQPENNLHLRRSMQALCINPSVSLLSTLHRCSWQQHDQTRVSHGKTIAATGPHTSTTLPLDKKTSLALIHLPATFFLLASALVTNKRV